MEDLDLGIVARRVEALDLRALVVGAGITLGGHHHAQRRLVVPVERDPREPAFRHCQQRRQQVGLQAHHQHLCLRVAEAYVVLDQLGTARSDH